MTRISPAPHEICLPQRKMPTSGPDRSPKAPVIVVRSLVRSFVGTCVRVESTYVMA